MSYLSFIFCTNSHLFLYISSIRGNKKSSLSANSLAVIDSRFILKFALMPISLKQLAFKYCSNSTNCCKNPAFAENPFTFTPSKKAFSPMHINSPFSILRKNSLADWRVRSSGAEIVIIARVKISVVLILISFSHNNSPYFAKIGVNPSICVSFRHNTQSFSKSYCLASFNATFVTLYIDGSLYLLFTPANTPFNGNNSPFTLVMIQ